MTTTDKARELLDAGIRNMEAAQGERDCTRKVLETLSATFFWRACEAFQNVGDTAGGVHQNPAAVHHSIARGGGSDAGLE